MLFSATLTPEVMRISGPILHDPARIDVAPSATPIEAISQELYPVNGLQKSDLLVGLLEHRRLERVLVFTRTKHRADKVCRHLERSRIRGAAIHSNRSQAQRQRALDGFKDGTFRVLVATDIVARGIDVEGISHVINYDLPMKAEDYVHRIGRTARAGATGTAISFLCRRGVQGAARHRATHRDGVALAGPRRLLLPPAHGARPRPEREEVGSPRAARRPPPHPVRRRTEQRRAALVGRRLPGERVPRRLAASARRASRQPRVAARLTVRNVPR